jgi:hypothetical protein
LPYIERYEKAYPKYRNDGVDFIYINDDPIVNEVKSFLEKTLNINIGGHKSAIGCFYDKNGGTPLHVHDPLVRGENHDFTSCLYLRDDYEGGEFVTNNLCYKPIAGSLTFFNGAKTYHGARAPIGNNRQFLVFWWESTSSNDNNISAA